MIKPEWGAQRIKGLSITKALIHAVKTIFSKPSTLSQKGIETSLIEQFLYPKYGPGQMWEETAKIVKEKGGEIYLNHTVTGLKREGNKIVEIKTKNEKTGEIKIQQGDYFFSTIPVKELIGSIGRRV